MRIDYYYLAALRYVYLWHSTSSAQVAPSVRAKYKYYGSFVCKQFWKLSLAYIDKTVSINVKQFHIFMMWLLFEMCG